MTTLAHLPRVPPSSPPRSVRPRRVTTTQRSETPDSDPDDQSPLAASTKAFDGPRSTEHLLGSSSRNRSSSSSTASLNNKHDPDTLFETHRMAPAPSQTYWQLMVLSDGHVVVRDWPRKRFSTKWTRDGEINPGEKKVPFDEMAEWEERIRTIFGDAVWETVKEKCGLPEEP
ncbi:hypothetical protein PhCBS80983_g01294 [Powellomyces hirtus]|uniref:Uncharacterized protein n=1 Tax=Powellomyces hirtus TaxID=109895 RepID=A0A507EBI6_9FUNG|nr:hypothetical protein PhCBS80983_g01294 [Powellomyces hirtus]